jgi:tetratricopeptide (TPR) repeat protein
MRVLYCLLIMGLSLYGSRASATDIYTLIVSGQLDLAEDSLAKLPSTALRDGNMLYYASMIETDAGKSAALMEAALGSSVSAIHREKIHYLLAQYYFLRGDYARLGEIVTEYMSLWETGRHRPQMQRLSTQLDEQAGQYESAARQADRYLKLFDYGATEQWGKVDKARITAKRNQKSKAHDLWRRLSRQKDGPGVAIALYQLTRQAIAERRIDDAVRYYDLLREGFPAAVGVDALGELMIGLSASEASDNAAEKITGTFYSVQVGVFSVKANADGLAADFSSYGHKVDIVRKQISSNKYYVVLVGRFDNFEAARAFKARAGNDRGETFQVVTR